MTKPLISLAALLSLASPTLAQGVQESLSPAELVSKAAEEEWIAIAPEDLLVMTLRPAFDGSERKVVIQLMPAPFSQGWVENIRALTRARWFDGVSVNRVQDNYVVQWGDPNADNPEAKEAAKALPAGLKVMTEAQYGVSVDKLGLPALVASAERDLPLETEGGLAGSDPVTGVLVANGLIDPYAQLSLLWRGWPIASNLGEDDLGEEPVQAWPVHCYGMVGVGRGLSPDTGSGAELYTVIGHAPRHLDRNIALVGRVIEGIEHLSSLPRGTGSLGFYEDPAARTPILSVRLASELPEGARPRFQYLSTDSETFAHYAEARANRRDPFFIVPAGGADICNIPVPIRRAGDS